MTGTTLYRVSLNVTSGPEWPCELKPVAMRGTSDELQLTVTTMVSPTASDADAMTQIATEIRRFGGAWCSIGSSWEVDVDRLRATYSALATLPLTGIWSGRPSVSFMTWPGGASRRAVLSLSLLPNNADGVAGEPVAPKRAHTLGISEEIIRDLAAASNASFDTGYLVQLCTDYNICLAGGCSVAQLFVFRAIVDHVPHVFGVESFERLANVKVSNSLKKVVEKIHERGKQIAHDYIHKPIGPQVRRGDQTISDWTQELNVLLAETVARVKSCP